MTDAERHQALTKLKDIMDGYVKQLEEWDKQYREFFPYNPADPIGRVGQYLRQGCQPFGLWSGTAMNT